MAGIDLFEAFVRVVELGGLSKAASSYGVTPAAMTKKIKTLEESLGLQLLKRSTRRIALTDNGETLFQQCLKIIQELKDTASIVEQLKGEPSGALHILASLDFGEQFILPFLVEFITEYTKIQPSVSLIDRMPEVLSDELDVIMGFSSETPDDWQREDLLNTQFITCASPSYLTLHGTPQHPDELTHHSLITHSHRTTPMNFKFLKPLSCHLHSYIQCNNTHTMRIAALNGVGITQLPDYTVKHYLRNGALIEILASYKEAPHDMHYYIKQAKYTKKNARLFVEFMMRKLTKRHEH